MPWYVIDGTSTATATAGISYDTTATGTAATTIVTSTTNFLYWHSANPPAARRGLDDVRAQQRREQTAQLERQADDAKAIARDLLLANLSPEQRETFEKHKWFVVEGGKTKTQYRIRGDGSLVGNVDVLQQGNVSHRLCAHCELNAVPLGDHLLAQKLMLELSEDEFLRVANRHG